MTADDKKDLLARYRLQQADETFDEAVFLFNGNKNPRSVINRIYYSMFYAVMALLVYRQFESSKHRGVLSFFNKHYIKEGIFSRDSGKTLNKAYELRLSSDYEEYAEISREQVEPFIDKAREFIDSVRAYLNK